MMMNWEIKGKIVKSIYLGSIFLPLSLMSCISAPDYKQRITEIGKNIISLSVDFEEHRNYRDTIRDFGYGKSTLYKVVYQIKYNPLTSKVIPGKGELRDMYSGNRAGYYMKLVDKKKEIWVRLRYDPTSDKFYMVNYVTKSK